MILKEEKNKVIRTIEASDKEEILKMYQSETFGLVGLLWDQRPSIVEISKSIDKDLENQSPSQKYLVLEINGVIVSYICVFQNQQEKIHLGCIVTKEEYKNQGYGSYILKFLQDYANERNLEITTESLSASNFLQKNNFRKMNSEINYIFYPQKVRTCPKVYPDLLDYNEYLKELEIEKEQDLQRYQKTLEFMKNSHFL